MANNTIIFDLDETLLNIRDGMHKALFHNHGKDIHWMQWDLYDLSKVYNIENQDILNTILEHQILEKATIEPYAKEIIDYTTAKGYDVIIMTARGWHPDGERITIDWLDRHNIKAKEISVTPLGETKGSYIKHYKNIKLFIDDHYDHIKDVQRTGHVDTSILINRPWNKNEQWTGKRIDHLKELAPLINKLELERESSYLINI